MSNPGRFAVYFAPEPHSAWWCFGADWLGRDDTTLARRAQPALQEFSMDELEALTAEPRRYGFHATLQAPMRLGRHRVPELVRRVNELAATVSPVPLGRLEPVRLDDFVAIVPVAPPPALGALAARCVMELDDLRAPLRCADLARRQPARLDARRRELLERWGYPNVLECFRFHMTLSGPVGPTQAGLLVKAMRPWIDRLQALEPLVLDRLCIFHEPEPGAAFRRIHDVPLGPR